MNSDHDDGCECSGTSCPQPADVGLHIRARSRVVHYCGKDDSTLALCGADINDPGAEFSLSHQRLTCPGCIRARSRE